MISCLSAIKCTNSKPAVSPFKSTLSLFMPGERCKFEYSFSIIPVEVLIRILQDDSSWLEISRLIKSFEGMGYIDKNVMISGSGLEISVAVIVKSFSSLKGEPIKQ